MYLQYQLKGSDEHFTISDVEAFWIKGGKLVIVEKGKNPGMAALDLKNLRYVNFEEMPTEEEIKELELESKIVDLIGDLTARSEKYKKKRDRWYKNDEMYNYYQGCKNAVDLCIVKLKETMGFYKEIEEGGKL